MLRWTDCLVASDEDTSRETGGISGLVARSGNSQPSLSCGQCPLHFVISGAFVTQWYPNNAAIPCVSFWAGKPGGIGF